MAIPLRVLIVEDSEDDMTLTVRELRRNGYDVQYERVDTAEAMSAALAEKQWDAILSDYSMPRFSALAALKLVQDKGLDLPFIIVSGTVGEDAAVSAMKLGAHDFFSKAKLTRLVPAIEREMREAAERKMRRSVEQMLHRSESRFRDLLESAPDAMVIVDNQGKIILVNAQTQKLFGYSSDELIGQHIETLIPQRFHESHAGYHAGYFVDPRKRPMGVARELLALRKDGSEFPVEIALSPLQTEEGMLVSSSIRDITERKQTQAELRALYNATSYLFNADSLLQLGQQVVQGVTQEFGQVDCGLLLVDQQHNRMIRLARAGEQRVNTDAPLYLDSRGLVPEAVNTEKMIYAPDVQADPRYVPNDSRTQSELVVPLRTAKGILAVLDLQSIERYAFSERDIRILSAFAERAAAALESMQLYEEINLHAAELEWRVAQRTAELQQSKDRVEAILNNSSDAIILVHPNGTIQQTNPAFTELFGYSSDTVYAQPITRFIEPEQADKLSESLQMIVKGDQAGRIDLLVHRENGSVFNAEVSFASNMDNKGNTINIICNVHDVTERAQTEEGLRRALEKEKELNELKTRFVSMVSHEFRTPLAVIQSSTDIVSHYSERLSDERKVEHLNKINLQVKHLTNLLDEILTLSKAQAVGLEFNPSEFQLDEMCRRIVDDLQQGAEQKRIELNIQPSNFPPLLADAKLMGQAVNNLLSNAIKYSPKGGKVRLNVTLEGGLLRLSVSDEGIGIPQEDRARLFEIFHRATNVGAIPGTGLGLAIIKQAVEVHGGSVDVDSEVGKGTTFTVKIPAILPKGHNPEQI